MNKVRFFAMCVCVCRVSFDMRSIKPPKCRGILNFKTHEKKEWHWWRESSYWLYRSISSLIFVLLRHDTRRPCWWLHHNGDPSLSYLQLIVTKMRALIGTELPKLLASKLEVSQADIECTPVDWYWGKSPIFRMTTLFHLNADECFNFKWRVNDIGCLTSSKFRLKWYVTPAIVPAWAC